MIQKIQKRINETPQTIRTIALYNNPASIPYLWTTGRILYIHNVLGRWCMANLEDEKQVILLGRT